jgi:hypothetical protein
MNDADDIGMVMTGGLVASAVDPGTTTSHGVDEGAGGVCANCRAVRTGPFCQECGQSGHVHRSVTALGHDILHGVFHFEGRIWQTLPMLAFEPGHLTRRYVRGERAKFVSPMALFLFSVFLLFTVMSRVTFHHISDTTQAFSAADSAISDEIESNRDKIDDLKEQRAERLADDPKADVRRIDRKIASLQEDVDALSATGAGISAIAPSKSDAPTDQGGHIITGIAGLDSYLNTINSNPALFAYKLKTASYKFSWALIPISMPFIWLLFFWRRDVGFYDHAIFAIHSLSFMTLMAAGLVALNLAGVSQWWLWLALALIPPVHLYKHLKYAYGLGRFGALWRDVALLSMTSVTSVLFFALLVWLEAE